MASGLDLWSLPVEGIIFSALFPLLSFVLTASFSDIY